MDRSQSTELLSKEEEATLVERIRSGDRTAKEAFLRANARLVDFFLRRYFPHPEYPDLLQYGHLGLLLALDRFDPSKGRFSTFAAFWVRRSVDEGLWLLRAGLCVPPHVVGELRTLSKTVESLTSTLYRLPLTSEIAMETGWTEKKIRTLASLVSDPVSVDTARSDGDSETPRSVDIADVAPPLSETVDFSTLRASLERLLSGLSEKESAIVTWRYGLNDDETVKTYREIGAMLGLSDERVRQLEKGILEKLGKQAFICDDSLVP